MIPVWLAAAALAIGQAAAAVYTNPVAPRDFPDPFVIRHAGRYYAYATQSGAMGFQAMESPDLVHWTHRGLVFTVPWAQDHYWAPEVIRRGRTFFMTYSALNPATGKHDIGIATASAPLGPFVHRAILVRGDDNRIGVIDATIFIDHGSAAYLAYSEESPRRIVMRRLAPDLLSVSPEITELVRPSLAWERGITEAPTLFARNGVYHLLYSGGSYQGDRAGCSYAVGHASARSVRGPYTRDAEPILRGRPGAVYGPGHQCVVRFPRDSWWLVYHGWNDEREPRYGSNPQGRSMRIDPMTWRGDHPVVDGPSTDARPAPAHRNLRAHPAVDGPSADARPAP